MKSIVKIMPSMKSAMQHAAKVSMSCCRKQRPHRRGHTTVRGEGGDHPERRGVAVRALHLPEGAAAQVIGLLVALVRVARRQHRLRLVQVRHVPVAWRVAPAEWREGGKDVADQSGPKAGRQAGGARQDQAGLRVVEGSKKACMRRTTPSS